MDYRTDLRFIINNMAWLSERSINGLIIGLRRSFAGEKAAAGIVPSFRTRADEYPAENYQTNSGWNLEQRFARY